MKRVCKNFYKQWNDNMCEMEICVGAWLHECLGNNATRLSKSIHTASSGFITSNHTFMQSDTARAEIGIINR